MGLSDASFMQKCNCYFRNAHQLTKEFCIYKYTICPQNQTDY